jgi:hypothetical protein
MHAIGIPWPWCWILDGPDGTASGAYDALPGSPKALFIWRTEDAARAWNEAVGGRGEPYRVPTAAALRAAADAGLQLVAVDPTPQHSDPLPIALVFMAAMVAGAPDADATPPVG